MRPRWAGETAKTSIEKTKMMSNGNEAKTPKDTRQRRRRRSVEDGPTSKASW